MSPPIHCPFLAWYPDDGDFSVEHHMCDRGVHKVHLSADFLRGDVLLVVREYVRP